MDLGTQFLVLDERVEVLAQNLGGFDERHLGADRTVGPDFNGQLVVVRLLADTRLFDLVADPRDRAVDGIDRNHPNFVVGGAVFGRRYVTTTVFDHHLHEEGDVVREMADDVIFIDDFHIGIGLHVVHR